MSECYGLYEETVPAKKNEHQDHRLLMNLTIGVEPVSVGRYAPAFRFARPVGLLCMLRGGKLECCGW